MLDNTDIAILDALQSNARTPIVQLADIATTSMASVQRRLKRLREQGYIQKEVAHLDRDKLGFDVKAIVAVELERDHRAELFAFKNKAQSDPNVQHCYCIAGEPDFVLIVVARNMKDYEAFTQRFFFEDQSVRKYRTSIVVSEQKACNSLPVLSEVQE